jgi:hypothetical protein
MMAVLTLPLGGCPPENYGVTRVFDVARFPDPDCIKAAIARVPEIRDFRYRAPDGGKDIFGADTGDRGQFDYSISRPEGSSAEMSFASNSRHPALAAHFSMNRDRQAARDSVGAVRALMLKVEDQLAQRCGMTIVGNVHESLP